MRDYFSCAPFRRLTSVLLPALLVSLSATSVHLLAQPSAESLPNADESLPNAYESSTNKSRTTLRLVTTGFDEAGKSIFVSDGEPDLMLQSGPGSYMGDLWKTDFLPATHQDGSAPQAYELEPKGAGGVKFRIASIPPQQTSKVKKNTKDNDEFGMHHTDTIDFITIISGEMFVRLDSGQETLLKTGDALVQRGTNHAWINRGEVPCVFSAVMIKPAIASSFGKADH